MISIMKGRTKRLKEGILLLGWIFAFALTWITIRINVLSYIIGISQSLEPITGFVIIWIITFIGSIMQITYCMGTLIKERSKIIKQMVREIRFSTKPKEP